MKSRILVAVVGIPLLLVILLLCPKIVTAAAVSVLAVIGVRELLRTTGLVRRTRMRVYTMIIACLVPLWSYVGSPMAAGAAAAAIFLLLLFCEALAAYPDVPFSEVTACLFAGIGIPLCLGSIVRIILQDNGRCLVVIPILIPFIADAGAYFAGRFLGKHKMAPELSPNKTIEGAVGGLLTGVAAMLVYSLVMQFGFGFSCHYLWALFCGLAGSLVSIIGDLAFSMIKRETGIKDYGTLFRGHGGVLDRFDSVIFAAPTVELLMLLIPILQ